MTDSWEWELIAKQYSLTEGPTWDGSDCSTTSATPRRPTDGTPKPATSEVWRIDTGQANG